MRIRPLLWVAVIAALVGCGEGPQVPTGSGDQPPADDQARDQHAHERGQAERRRPEAAGRTGLGAGRSQVQILSPRYDGVRRKALQTAIYRPPPLLACQWDWGTSGEQFSAGERGTERLVSRLACPLSESAMSCRDALRTMGWVGSGSCRPALSETGGFPSRRSRVRPPSSASPGSHSTACIRAFAV
jgi:hypothetical protein